MSAAVQHEQPGSSRARRSVILSRLALEELYARQREADAAEDLSEADVDQFLSLASPTIRPLPEPGDELASARGLVWGLVLAIPLWCGIAALAVTLL